MQAQEAVDMSAMSDVLKPNRRVLLVVVLIGVVVALYAPTFESMMSQWTRQGYQHATLVPGIVLFLLWRSRAALAPFAMTGSWYGVVTVCLAVWVWLVAKATSLDVLEHLSAYVMILGFVLAVV